MGAFMKVTARGWSRDHGEKAVLSAGLTYEDVSEEVESLEAKWRALKLGKPISKSSEKSNSYLGDVGGYDAAPGSLVTRS
jgi:cobalamin biosynthesis Co2+ chelatase CbiK